MIDYKLFQYAAPPLCGVDWFVKAVQLCGFGPGFVARAYEGFREVGDGPRVSTVRHPEAWLRLLYKAAKEKELVKIHEFEVDVRGIDSFESFYRCYLRERPGWISRLYNFYEAEIVLRMEDIPSSFIDLMDSMGVDRSLSEMSRKLRIEPIPIRVEGPLLRELKRTERDIFERYDY